MAVKFRTYTGGINKCEDYKKLHDFLVESKNTEYTYARFDWMMTNREYLEAQYLDRIGIWEDGNQIVATTLYDHSLDDIFPIAKAGYEFLYSEMLAYAKSYMKKGDNPDFRVYICDTNQTLKKAALESRMMPTECKEMVAFYDLSGDFTGRNLPKVNLPEGYSIISLEDSHDFEKYAQCLFKGFDHEANGETFNFTEELRSLYHNGYEREYVELNLKILIIDSYGNYVAHCGMWYDKNSDIALVEPVCTIPNERGRGLGKQVVLEGLHRVKEMGAKKAVVGSNERFYFSIGFIPQSTGTFWIEQPIKY